MHVGCGLLLCWWITHATDARKIETASETKQALSDVVQYCRSLTISECYTFIDQLGVKKDFSALEAIYKSSVPGSTYALTVIAMRIDSSKIVSLCAQFPIGSSNWKRVFYVMDNHPKCKVIHYIHLAAQSTDPEIRASCYRLCQKAGWDDLVLSANRDRNCQLRIFIPGSPFPDTVASVALSYLGSIEHLKRERSR